MRIKTVETGSGAQNDIMFLITINKGLDESLFFYIQNTTYSLSQTCLLSEQKSYLCTKNVYIPLVCTIPKLTSGKL